MAATCSISSESCCLWAISPCSFSVVWLNSFWTWRQTKMTHTHTINIHTDKWLTQTCVNILVPKQEHYTPTHTRTQKLLDLCAKLVASFRWKAKVKHKIYVAVKNRTNKYLKTKEEKWACRKRWEKAVVRVMSTQSVQTVVSINSCRVGGVLDRLEIQHFFTKVMCHSASVCRGHILDLGTWVWQH